MEDLFIAEQGQGSAIVFLHGFCETHEIWLEFAKPLSQNYRLIFVDLPGFGESPLLEGKTLEDRATQVVEALKRRGVHQFLLVGHSLGGYVSLAIETKYTEMVEGLVLFHSTAFADTEEKKENRNKVVDFVSKNGVAPFIENFVPPLFADQQHPAIARMKSMGRDTPKETVLWYTKAMRDRPDRTSTLRKATKPVMIIAGLKDAVIPIKTLEEQVTFLQRPTFITLNLSGHMGMLEESEKSVRAIENFALTVNAKP